MSENGLATLLNIEQDYKPDLKEKYGWDIDPNYSFFYSTVNKSNNRKIHILIDEHIKFIMGLGFYVYYLPNKEHVLLKVENNIAAEVIKHDIVSTYRKKVRKIRIEVEEAKIDSKQLLAAIDNRGDSLFTPYILHQLRAKQPLYFNQDTHHWGYHYFKNGFVEVNKDKVTFKQYSEMSGLIWDFEKHQRDFKPTVDFKEGIFYKFLNNVANNKDGEHPKRLLSLMTIIGYMIHRYQSGQLVAPILTDGRISDDEEAEGRSGKGLITKGIDKFLNTTKNSSVYMNVSGKDFKEDNRFKWQKLTGHTKAVHLDDAQRNFSIESLFVDIDSGISAETKGNAPVQIVAKIIITTNKTIKTAGGSARARVKEYELADHYSEEYTPQDEFNCWFWTDWDEDEMGRFDATMLECLRLYLAHRIVDVPGLVLAERKLREETRIQFVEFMTDFYIGKLKLQQPEDKKLDEDPIDFSFETRIDKKILLNEFCYHYDEFKAERDNPKSRFSVQFTKWLRTWSFYHEDFRKINVKNDETKSGKNRYITFHPSKVKLKQMEAEKLKKEKDDKDKSNKEQPAITSKPAAEKTTT